MIEVGEVVTVRARDEEYQALVVEGPFWRIDRVDGSEPCTVDEEQLEVIGERAAFDMVMRALRAGHQNDRSANELFTWLRNMRRPRRETSVGRASTATSLPERAVKRLFRELQDLGIGRYIKGGRGGHKCRFRWSFPVSEVVANFFTDIE